MNSRLMFYLFGAIFLSLVLIEYMRFRSRKVDFKHFFKWGILWFGISLVFILSEQISWIIQFVGIGLPFNFISILGFCLIFCMLWNLYLRFERIEARFGELVQKIALKEEESC